MNPLEQRLAIEESIGLVERGGGPLGIYWQDNFGNGDRYYLDPEEASKVYLHLPCIEDGIAYYPLPDYLNDLNAMHEVEGAMVSSQWIDYEFHLGMVIVNQHGEAYLKDYINATAAQRAEAYLRTIGKWKD